MVLCPFQLVADTKYPHFNFSQPKSSLLPSWRSRHLLLSFFFFVLVFLFLSKVTLSLPVKMHTSTLTRSGLFIPDKWSFNLALLLFKLVNSLLSLTIFKPSTKIKYMTMKFSVLRLRDMSYFISINLFNCYLLLFFIQADSKTWKLFISIAIFFFLWNVRIE